MTGFKPTHEQRMQELQLKTARNLLYGCFGFIPFYMIIRVVAPDTSIPNEIIELVKFIAYTTIGFFVGSGSSMIPKEKS